MTKTALVTGATGLLGREVQKSFQRAGWDVVGTGFSRAQPPLTLQLDLRREEEVIAILDKVQ